MFCLGGRLASSTMAECLKAVEKWWWHVFDLSGGPADEDRKVLHGQASCVFAFEMRPSSPGQENPDIEVKLHVPMWVLGKTDAQLSARLAEWFRIHNHAGFADRYLQDLEYAL
ncbi:hypothetical protein ONZ43_g7286 [Nemania bipapillata]|uniref:Uncharacterized protein n=1 Tax=Nemania bipapillata TaxID=110536 RepID=A0ACC2HRT6_9PEZI|nr:hypothetical protein ONZ43_g7286 [Nemania bipapillata]